MTRTHCGGFASGEEIKFARKTFGGTHKLTTMTVDGDALSTESIQRHILLPSSKRVMHEVCAAARLLIRASLRTLDAISRALANPAYDLRNA